jgi:cysteine desulfurase / selenocysteine lyase
VLAETASKSETTTTEGDTTFDWESTRADFPILDQEIHGYPLIYFDNAATSQKPRAVIDAISRYYERDNANVHRGIHELSNRATAGYESARKTAAKFLNAASENEIIFTRGTTEAVNLIARSWGDANIKAGDKILLTEMEHHSNIVPWQLLAERAGATLVYVPVTGDEGILDLDQLDALLADSVKLFSMVHISNSLGTINPVAEMCAAARNHGVTTIVDAAQSGGHFPLDVQQIDCDFLAISGHKMCGPTGIGCLYGKETILNAMPPFHGGGEMILTVDYHEVAFKKAPHKFEAGTPNIAGAIGMAAAMDYIEAIGRERIFHHDQELGAYALDAYSKLPGIRIFGPTTGRAGVVSFAFEGVHAHDVVTLTDQRGLALRGGHHCTQPLMKKLGVESTSRASFYFYNTKAEIDRSVEILRGTLKFFGVEA